MKNPWPRFVVAIASAGTIAAPACSDSLAPTLYVQPMLAEIAVDSFYSVLGDSGLLGVRAVLADSSTDLAPNARLRFSVLTSSGDSEDIGAERKLCGQVGSLYLCTGLVITMDTGHSALEICEAIASIPARFWSVSSSGKYGSVRVFDSRAIPRAIQIITGTQLVAHVDQDVLFSTGPSDQHPFARVFGAVPLNIGSPVPKNGLLESRHGDSLLIRYLQPNGSVSELRLLLP